MTAGPFAVRRATEADIPLMRRLWDEFSAEGHYTPYPSTPFDPVLVRDHVALLAEEDAAPTVPAKSSKPRRRS